MRRGGLSNGARHGWDGGQVKYNFGAVDCCRYRGVIPDIAALEGDARTYLIQIPFMTGQQVVDHAHLAISPSYQRAHQRGADEARTSRDHVLFHALECSICFLMNRSESSAILSAPGAKSNTSSDIQ